MERIYIGMGSNLAEPAEQLRSAIQALAQLPDTQLVGVSAFYQSDSLLPGQPRYTNAVAALDSRLAPLDLLDALQAIETGQGRERLERWGPRTLDLDILLFGDRLIDEPRLKVPPTTTCRPGPSCCTHWPSWHPPTCTWPMDAHSRICSRRAHSPVWNACLQTDANPCGSELARDSVGTSSIQDD
nr:hypothetical protein GCM10020185_46470 [Pseudomonas brassicacearum subsp. brassicacearum]